MTATTTATVETLTAEVHVLKVGNRQITLSVAKQLDVIPLVHLTPFGRISIRDDGPQVIGRGPDGSLCTSYIAGRLQVTAKPLDGVDTSGKQLPVFCLRQSHRHSTDFVYAEFEGSQVMLAASQIVDRHAEARAERRYCSYEHDPSETPRCDREHCGPECAAWDPCDFRDIIRENVRKHRAAWSAEQAARSAARKLPLIVLAGLK